MTISPFKEFEERYCNNCDDYNGCVGLMLSTFAQSSDVSEEYKKRLDEGQKIYLEMVKSIGASVFTQKYSMILNCMKAREFMKFDESNKSKIEF